jgi:hypothetical protein
MPLSPDFMRFLLLVCIFCMALLSAFYLRRRALTPLAYAGWGLLALMLPIIGPFLVIWAQPGEKFPPTSNR